jgi:hypothetical protein
MKLAYGIILFIGPLLGLAQGNCGSLKDFEKSGGNTEQLNKTYQKVLGGDSLQPSVFENADGFMNGPWLTMFMDLAHFLKKSNFSFEKPAVGTHVVYFKKNGKIDRWLYTFHPSPDEKKRAEFDKLLAKFIKKYKVRVKATVDFYQCSSMDLFMIMQM